MHIFNGYSLGILISIIIHGSILTTLLYAWDSNESKIIITPSAIEASLVKFAPNPKPVKKTDNNLQKKVTPKKAVKKAPKVTKNSNVKETMPQKNNKQIKKIEEKKINEDPLLRRAEIEKDFEESLLREQKNLEHRESEEIANSFRQIIQRQLSDNWSRPPSARTGMQATLRLNLVPTGRIVGITIINSSGDLAFDRSVEQAALKSAYFEEIGSMPAKLFEQKFRTIEVLFSPEDLRL